MPLFQYKSMDGSGKPRAGVIDADSPKDARDKIRRMGLHVTEIAASRDGPGRPGGSAAPAGVSLKMPKFLRGGKHLAELAMVTRQLATLLGAGIPISDALRALIEQIEGTRMEGIFRSVREKITQGASFGNALSAYPEYFSDLYVNMVRAGEAAGNLDQILVRLAEYLREQHRLRSKVMAAVTYPAIMGFVGFAVVVFLMAFVVPNITRLLASQGAALPLPTRFLIAASDFFTGGMFGIPTALYWFLWTCVLLGALAGVQAIRRTERGRRAFDAMLFRIPVLGELFKKQAISRFATTFATLLKSGIPAAESLRVVQRVLANKVLEDTISEVHDRIMEGADISVPLKKSGVFPPVVGYMIAIGEQAGKLDEILEKVAESYDEEVEVTTQKVVSLIEPLLIVFMAVIVGFIVLSIILPILEITKMAGQ